MRKTELVVENLSNQSNKTQNQTGWTALFRQTLYEWAIKVMGQTFEDMDRKSEHTEIKVTF